MSSKMKEVLESIKGMSSSEKALLAHCILSSLDKVSEENVDDTWLSIAEERYAQLASGGVKAISWDEIKKGIKN
jgi:Putative addiction module component